MQRLSICLGVVQLKMFDGALETAEPQLNVYSYYEFFAGGGMARAGLAEGWRCDFANDFDAKKAASYAANWSDERLRVADVASLKVSDLPGNADLAWASFPCQDLSLAGDYAGLKGTRSGTFWGFWSLVKQLRREGRAPRLIVLALASADYRFGALVVDAAQFLPQSRPRLFIIAVQNALEISPSLLLNAAGADWHPENLREAYRGLSPQSKRQWLWWNLKTPPPRRAVFADLIEDEPKGVAWNSAIETTRLLDMMTPLNRSKVATAQRSGRKQVGAVCKRTRADENGERRQRAEVRFDDLAGCLRTPVGGSSRQTILAVDGENVNSRLLSPREAARLMGLPDSYLLPRNYNDAYHLAGDGLAVPVVRFLAANLLEPLLAATAAKRRKAA